MRVFYLFILLIWISPNVKGQLDSHSDYNKLHCVSIGVSDYKNIRSLNFAHNDAISFAEFVSKNQLWRNANEIARGASPVL